MKLKKKFYNQYLRKGLKYLKKDYKIETLIIDKLPLEEEDYKYIGKLTDLKELRLYGVSTSLTIDLLPLMELRNMLRQKSVLR